MKKNILLSMSILSTVAVLGATPLISHAAESETGGNLSNRCYKVYAGQGIESLTETLKQLGITLGNNGNVIPGGKDPEVNIPCVNVPGAEKPDTSTPDTDTPDTSTPDTDIPNTDDSNTDNSQTQKPNTPGTETLSYAEQVVQLVNKEREKAGLSTLTMDADITAAANVRAKEIVQKFSHTRPDGSNFGTVLKEQGVSFKGSGENIAWGQKSPEQVMNAWMNSDGHRANILNKNFKNIGVGYYQNEKGVNYWVQLFTY